jgi:hypothetical protein
VFAGWVNGSPVRNFYFLSLTFALQPHKLLFLANMPPTLKMLFPVLPNLIAIRSKRKQQTGTSTSQSRSSTADIPGNLLSELIDGIQLVAPVVQTVAGAIPVAGSPLSAAIGALLQIIQITDVGRSSDFKECLLITP